MKKDLKTPIKIDFTKYVNSETGEMLMSEIQGKGVSITANEETTLFTIYREDYAVISTETILKLKNILPTNILGYLLQMIPLTRTDLNIIYNHSVPHTNESLQKYLNVSNMTFFNAIKKLTNAGVLYQMKGNINGAIRVIYIINPFISAKRKTFDKQLLNVFKSFENEK